MSKIEVHAEVKGLRELDKRLGELESKLATKILDKALRKAAKPILDAAKAGAPVESGTLIKSIKIRKGKAKRGLRSVIVGVGDKWFLGDEFYAAFVEFGHLQGSRKLGNTRKKIPGEHFIEYAYDEQKAAATQLLIQTLGELIDKAIKGD
jgi:HK97 gp10 family phage protein